MSPRLTGKIALVTGGAKGIGRTISASLAREGCSVMMFGRDKAAGDQAVEGIRRDGGAASFVAGDLGEEDDVRRAIDEARQQFGPITVLINNAAALDQGGLDGTVTDVTLDAWNRLLRVNLTGVFLMSRYVIPDMQAAGGGSIISMSSLAGVAGVHTMAAYSAAKGGVGALMRSIATDFGKENIRANTIVLGMVPHDYLSIVGEEPLLTPNLEAHMLPYLGTPEDAAYACIYLASDESRFVTGSELRVEGGARRYPPVIAAQAYIEGAADQDGR